MAAHGFYDGLEGHVAAFGVGHGLGQKFGAGVLDQGEVPLADGGEDGEGLLGGERRVGAGPVVLIEGLDYVVGLGCGVAEADGEDEFAVGEVLHLRVAPESVVSL